MDLSKLSDDELMNLHQQATAAANTPPAQTDLSKLSDDDLMALHAKATAAAKPADTSHDLIPFLKNAWQGVKDQANELSSKPLPTIAYEHLVQPAVDAYHHARDQGENPVMAGLAAGAKGTGDVANVGTSLVTPEITPVQAYFHSRQQGSTPEDAFKDASHVALLLGAPKIAGKVAGPVADAAGWTGKKAAKSLAGVSEGTIDRYRANPEAVNTAPDLPTTVKALLADADQRAAQGSADSTAAFNTLKDTGTTPVAAFTKPLADAADHIHEMGVGDPRQVGAMKWLNDRISSLQDYVDENGQIPLNKGKSLINSLRTEQGNLEGKVDTQTLKAYSNAIGAIDDHLKATSPEYAAQMEQLAGDTQAATALTDKFRTPEGAMNTLKQIQSAKPGATFKADALQGYEDRFGTNFGEDLKNGYAKADFEKQTTNGSRKVQIGKGIGGAAGAAFGTAVGGPTGGIVGGFVGQAIGGVAGGLADTYGGQAVKTALNAGIKLDKIAGTPYAKTIMQAAQQGPAKLAVTHYLLSQKDPGYQATQKDDE